MPRLTRSVPKYRKHRPSRQAVVTLDGQDFYLGPYGAKASHYEYDRLITEWLANGRHLPAAEVPGITASELSARYWTFAKSYYIKDGMPTDTQAHIKVVLRVLRELYGGTPAAEFGPSRLKAVRQKLIDGGQSRLYVNGQMGILCRVFKWGAVEELIPVVVHDSIRIVPGLRKGRTTAPGHPDVKPVSEADIQATLPHLPPIVADMLRFQRATGARPGEIWEYRPGSHKTQHHNKTRVISIGPKAFTDHRNPDPRLYAHDPVEPDEPGWNVDQTLWWSLPSVHADLNVNLELPAVDVAGYGYAYRPMGAGSCVIVNEAHGLQRAQIEKLLGAMENAPAWFTWIFTTTNEGSQLFEEQLGDIADTDVTVEIHVPSDEWIGGVKYQNHAEFTTDFDVLRPSSHITTNNSTDTILVTIAKDSSKAVLPLIFTGLDADERLTLEIVDVYCGDPTAEH